MEQLTQQFALELGPPALPPLTCLSFGGGQDSSALYYLYIHDEAYRRRFVPGDYLFLMSDTGDEHPRTYVHVREIERLSYRKGIRFRFITKDQGLHVPSWPSLREHYRAKQNVGSKAFRKSCTDKLKIQPLYKALCQELRRLYGEPRSQRFGDKTPLYVHTGERGKVRVLIGIAKGEESRLAKDGELPRWMRENVERVYPLIELGMDRRACQEYIRSLGYPVPPPSNCMLCPYLCEVELVYLERFHPEDFLEWVTLERAKLARDRAKPRNLGVFGERTLPETLEVAREKYGHWTDAQLEEWKMSHGHCVASRY
jgi:3'-phosphoadenosine 5'-phosphosulfate sulfotransferase (PAPS reductase)/FAD synthetase